MNKKAAKTQCRHSQLENDNFYPKHLVLASGHAASQCLFAVHLDVPNCLALTLFKDATQSVPGCYFPIAPGLWIRSGVETSWRF